VAVRVLVASLWDGPRSVRRLAPGEEVTQTEIDELVVRYLGVNRGVAPVIRAVEVTPTLRATGVDTAGGTT
jgi:hypothetical protein